MSHRELQRIYVSWRQPLLLSWAFLGPKSQVMRNKSRKARTLDVYSKGGEE